MPGDLEDLLEGLPSRPSNSSKPRWCGKKKERRPGLLRKFPGDKKTIVILNRNEWPVIFKIPGFQRVDHLLHLLLSHLHQRLHQGWKRACFRCWIKIVILQTLHCSTFNACHLSGRRLGAQWFWLVSLADSEGFSQILIFKFMDLLLHVLFCGYLELCDNHIVGLPWECGRAQKRSFALVWE